jgi:GT2 family glycosyltransferase
MEANIQNVAAIVLNWNDYEASVRCVESLKRQDYPHLEIFVVDNASTDGSAERLQSVTGVIQLSNPENLGYAGGNNVGLRAALARGADVVLVVNNDAVVKSTHMISRLIEVFTSTPRCGILGPRVRDLRPPHRRSDLYHDSRYFWLLRRLLQIEVERAEQRAPLLEPTDRVSGCAIALRRSCLDAVGLFDERFFLYVEEVDLCFRAIRAGYSVLHLNDETECVYHALKDGTEPRYARYYNARNMFHCCRKLAIGWRRSVALAIHTATYFVLAARSAAAGDVQGARWYLFGLRDGFRGVAGRCAAAHT